MFRRAVISVLLGLLLACIADGLPGQMAVLARAACYIAIGFAVISALLSLFEEAEESSVSELEESNDVVRREY